MSTVDRLPIHSQEPRAKSLEPNCESGRFGLVVSGGQSTLPTPLPLQPSSQKNGNGGGFNE